MNRLLNKLKPVLLLLGLSILCVLIVVVTNQFRVSANQVKSDRDIQQKLPEVEFEDMVVEEVIVDSSEPKSVEEDEGLVLAVTQTSTNIAVCPANTMEIKSQSVCSQEGSGPVDYKDGIFSGDRVRRDSQVFLSEVKVPLELYSGMEVKDSNRLITSETPTFKAAGEQIDETSANVMLPPGTQIEEHKSWIEEEPFTTKYSLAFKQKEEEPSETGNLGIFTKLPNQCEYCNNKSNPNPDKSNKISEFMLDSTYRYPTEKENIEDEDLIENCEDNSKFIKWESDYDGCSMNLLRKAIAIFRTITDALFNRCNTDEDSKDACVRTEDIIIIMASPFGSEKDCKDGTCTNAYMATRNGSAMVPSSATSNKTYYTTPCKAVIEGQERNITCAWDMSHLYKERKVNEFDDAPTLDSTPTDSEYNEFLLKEVQGTRGTDIPM